MDSKLTIPVPKRLSLAEACTVGVAAYTASLAVFKDLKIPIPDPKRLPSLKEEWALVLGGASSVGKMAIQILKACGYKVIATASIGSFGVVKAAGADECVNYKQELDVIVSEIVEKTGGVMYRAFDAVGKNYEIAAPLFEAINGPGQRFTTTNDWEPKPPSDFFQSCAVSLGPVGRPEAKELNADIASYIPFLYAMLDSGKLTGSESITVGAPGLESIPEAYAYQKAGKGVNKKVIVNISDV